jgi:hypothetical protein
MEETKDTRHPWTYAADFVRALGPVSNSGIVLSRSDASQIIGGVAAAIGMSKEELADVLSRRQQAKTDYDHDREAKRVMQALGFGFQVPN